MPLTRRAVQSVLFATVLALLLVAVPFVSPVQSALAAGPASLAADAGRAYQAGCPTPRPPMQLQTQALGDGRIQATLRAGSGSLVVIRFGAMQNAHVEVPGSSQSYASNAEIKAPSGAPEFTFVVVSDAPAQIGQNGQPSQAPPAVTVPLTAYDGCGVGQPWTTFVGGGTTTLQSAASVADTQVTEGDAGNTALIFTVKLSVPSSREISLTYATADGTARAGIDYVAANGTVTFNPGETSKQVTVQVRGNFAAEPDKTFTITLSNPVNAALGKAQATARILNDDTGPGASGDAYTANAGQPLTVGEGAGPPPGLLVNDRAGSQAVQIASFGGGSAPGDVATHPAGTTASLGNGGTLTVNANGSFAFLAPSGFSGAFSFKYRATSNAGSSEATVIITVVGPGPDTAPVAVADALTVAEDSGATALDVLANDTDPDGGPKTITAKTNGSNGATVAITNGGSDLTYQPAADFCGTDTFTYTLNGGPTAAQTGAVTVTVTCAQDKPSHAAITATAQANVPLNVPALASIVDPDAGVNGCTPTYQIVSLTPISPAGGSLSIDTSVTPNVLVFDPPVGTTGTSTFSYAIQDSGCPGPAVTSDPVPVTVNVVGTDGTASGPIMWFVNNNAGACASDCDGRLSHPFNTVADFRAVNLTSSPTAPKNNHVVFLYESPTAYVGQILLGDGQKLIGQDASKSLAELLNLTVDPAWAALPTTNVAGGTVTIDSDGHGASVAVRAGVTLRGFTLKSQGDDIALLGHTFGTLTLAAGTASDPADIIVNAEGPALELRGGTVNGALISTSSTAGGVMLDDIAGTFNLGGGALTGADGPAFGVESVFMPGMNTATLSYSGTITAGELPAVLIVDRPAGAGPITLSGAVTGVAGQSAVTVLRVAEGTITFSGKVTAPSTVVAGIFIQNNGTDATVAFSGGLDIDTTFGVGFSATDGGTVTVTGTGNTIDSTAGVALQVTDITIGAAGLTFERISSGNNTGAQRPSVGIALLRTGTLAGLTVTGNGSTDSGGIIQHVSSFGIRAEETSHLSITDMLIDTPARAAIMATDVGGTWKIANSRLTGFGRNDAIEVTNTDTDLTKLTITGTTISNGAFGISGVALSPDGTSDMTVSIEGQSAFEGLTSDAVSVTPGTTASGTVNLTVKDSSFTSIEPTSNGNVIDLAMTQSDMTLTANIENNTFDTITLESEAATVFTANTATSPDSPTLNATVKGNTFKNIDGGSAILATASGSAGPTSLLIDGNTIDELTTNDTGPIDIVAVGNVSMDATVQNNKIGQNGALWPGDGNQPAVEVLAQNAATVRAFLDKNTITGDVVPGAGATVRIVASDGGALDATVTNNNVAGSIVGRDGLLLQSLDPAARMNVLATQNAMPTNGIRLLGTGSAVLTYNADMPGMNTYQSFSVNGASTTSTPPTPPNLPPLPLP